MNKVKLACIAALLLTGDAFATEKQDTFGDTNPFAKDYHEKKNQKINPDGLVVYSFSENDNWITQSTSDSYDDYKDLLRQTNQFGYAQVDQSQMANFKQLIRDYKSADVHFNRELKLAVMKAQGASKSDINTLSNSSIFTNLHFNSFVDSSKDIIHQFIGGNFIRGQGWNARVSIINSNKLGTVIINESAYSHSGGLIVDSDVLNFSINDMPASLVVKEDIQGNAETMLTWATDTNAYDIQFNKNVNKNNLMDELMRLAMTIASPVSNEHP